MDPAQATPVQPNTSPVPAISTPAPTPVKKPFNKKWLVFGGLGFIIFIIVITVIIIMGAQKKTQPVNINPTRPPESSPTPGAMDNYRLLRVGKLGFMIRIPKNWKENLDSAQQGVVKVTAGDESTLQIVVIPTNDKTLVDLVNQASNTSKEILDTEEATIAGTKGYKQQEKWLAAGFTTQVTYFVAGKNLFIFSIIPSGLPDIADTDVAKAYDEILSSFKTILPFDLSKWKVWNDPNEFVLKYPQYGRAMYTNNITEIAYKSDSGSFSLYFCKDCKLSACEGDCSRKKEIELTIGNEIRQEQQYWPNIDGWYTFSTKLPYPNKFKRQFLTIWAKYESEDNLEEINLILSTFDWKNKPTPTPTPTL